MIKNICVSAVISLAVSSSVVVIHSQYMQQTKSFASVNLREIMSTKLDSYKAKLEKGESLPPEDAIKFADALENAMKSLEADESKIVLNSPAVISGVEDMTPVVVEMINAELNADAASKS